MTTRSPFCISLRSTTADSNNQTLVDTLNRTIARFERRAGGVQKTITAIAAIVCDELVRLPCDLYYKTRFLESVARRFAELQ